MKIHLIKGYMFLSLIAGFLSNIMYAQSGYDSLTMSRFSTMVEMPGVNWSDSLKAGRFSAYVSEETKVWDKSNPSVNGPELFKLMNKIKSNGTADVAKCFIPLHSINYYKAGKIIKYLLICFECDGLRFSDDPANTFVKNIETRYKQMQELGDFFGPGYLLEKKIIGE